MNYSESDKEAKEVKVDFSLGKIVKIIPSQSDQQKHLENTTSVWYLEKIVVINEILVL